MTRSSTTAVPATAKLRILATTDLHMHLTGFDYSADRDRPGRGLDRVARLIAEARDEAQGEGTPVLLVDNGDALQGTPLANYLAETATRPHPMVRAFAMLGYDAIGLGNHDLDFGLETLALILRDAPCPVLCANLKPNDPARLPLEVETILEVPPLGLRVGLFSCLPPQTAMWNAQHLRGRAEISDMLTSARARVASLQRRDCDVIVALAHTGTGSDLPRPGMENAATVLAGMTGVDAVVAGHSHDVIPEGLGKGAMVQPGAMGSHLGLIDLELRRAGNGRWQVSGATAQTNPADGPPDPAVTQLVQASHTATRDRLNRPVGHSDVAMHSYFSGFGRDAGLAVLSNAQASALRPYLQGSELSRFPVLSAVAPGRSGGRGGPANYTDIPPGPVLERHLYDLSPFDNTLAAGLLTGAQVLDWLEMSAGRFARIGTGETAPLLDPAFPGHNFDVIFGLDYEIDPTVPARYDPNGDLLNPEARRIRKARWQDRPLDLDQRFVVAMSSYRAHGGGNFPPLRNLVSVGLPDLPLRDVLRKAFARGPEAVQARHMPWPWRIAQVSGATALVPSGPGARTHLQELAAQGVTETGLDADGFLGLRVPLAPV